MSIKRQGTRWLLFIIMLAVAGLAGFYAQKTLNAPDESKNAVVSSTPDFILPDVKGVEYNSKQWQGKVLIVNFWATWCPPCLREMPLFIDLQKEYGDQGLQFVGIAIDTREKVEEFMTRMDVNYPLLVASSGGTSLAIRYGNVLGALPFTAVINRDGKIAFTQAGEITRKKAEEHIIPLL